MLKYNSHWTAQFVRIHNVKELVHFPVEENGLNRVRNVLFCIKYGCRQQVIRSCQGLVYPVLSNSQQYTDAGDRSFQQIAEHIFSIHCT